MAGRDVQRFEVVPLRLHLSPELDLIAKALEHGLDLPPHLRQDVDVTAAKGWTGQGDVDGLCLGDVCEPRSFKLGAPVREPGLDRTLGLVRPLAKCSALGGRQLSDAGQQAADPTVLSA